MISSPNIEDTVWDAIIVGTGIGGATIGYTLAKAGKRVLFCEKGLSHLSNENSLVGKYAESFFPKPEYPHPKHRNLLKMAGRWCDEIEDLSTSQKHSFIPFIGSGTGGSSALYGMAMERFSPTDFSPKHFFAEETDSSIPESWPISYDDLLPYYIMAESLYRVRGSGDPLRVKEPYEHLLPPPPLLPVSQELSDFFRTKGLHPYRLPMACEYVPECAGSQGYLCDKDCKNDSSRVCLVPAMRDHGAQLIDECRVTRLEADTDVVTRVRCIIQDREISLKGNYIIIAAGALETPKILLNSSSTVWPNGLANKSGLVGKNLMRHFIDLYAISSNHKGELTGNIKEIAFNDFYCSNGKKLGTVQSFGPMPPASIMAAGIEHDLVNSSLPWLSKIFALAKPAATVMLQNMFKQSIVFATIVEDLPFERNLVMPSPQNSNNVAIQYRINNRELSRIAEIRKQMTETLKPYRFTLIKQAENNERIAHACGTCRFGHDPELSVLNQYNKAHGIRNLFVVDSSFFPSSGGTNPALTIAANALRVADHLVKTWGTP